MHTAFSRRILPDPKRTVAKFPIKATILNPTSATSQNSEFYNCFNVSKEKPLGTLMRFV